MIGISFLPLVKGNILYICINVTGKSMRKKLLWLFCIVVLSYVTAAAAGKAEITFEKPLYDFGRVDEKGGEVSHDFLFTNTGDEPLVIYEINTNCGCTTAQFPLAPILPGEKGKITIVFSPEGNPGEFAKEIIVKSNANKKKNTPLHKRCRFPQTIRLHYEEEFCHCSSVCSCDRVLSLGTTGHEVQGEEPQFRHFRRSNRDRQL